MWRPPPVTPPHAPQDLFTDGQRPIGRQPEHAVGSLQSPHSQLCRFAAIIRQMTESMIEFVIGEHDDVVAFSNLLQGQQIGDDSFA